MRSTQQLLEQAICSIWMPNIDIAEEDQPIDPMYVMELFERYDLVGTEWNQQG